MQTHLTAVQINCLAQRLSEAPLGRSATGVKAAERFQRLLSVRIGQERGDVALTSILSAATFEQAEARLTLILTYGNTAPAADSRIATASPDVDQPRATAGPQAAPPAVTGKRKALVNQAAAGVLPPAPDFSKPTHARFRNKLAQIVALAEAGEIAALQAFEINPVSSSPKAMARYRDLCVIAIAARTQVAA